MDTTMKRKKGILFRTETIPCGTEGCKQIFQIDRAVAAESRDAFLGVLYSVWETRLLYRCPKCGCEGKLWQPDEVGSPILCVRPLVEARHILRFDPAQIARLARILTEIGDKIEWVLGQVVVQARALARRIKAAKAAPARS